MTEQQNSNLPKAPKGFLGTLADLLQSSSSGGAKRRPTGGRQGGFGRPQPKKPCGGCK